MSSLVFGSFSFWNVTQNCCSVLKILSEWILLFALGQSLYLALTGSKNSNFVVKNKRDGVDQT